MRLLLLIRAGCDKVRRKVNNGQPFSSAYCVPATLWDKYLQILLHLILMVIVPVLQTEAQRLGHCANKWQKEGLSPWTLTSAPSILLNVEDSGWRQGFGVQNRTGGGPSRTAVSGINREPKHTSRFEGPCSYRSGILGQGPSSGRIQRVSGALTVGLPWRPREAGSASRLCCSPTPYGLHLFLQEC